MSWLVSELLDEFASDLQMMRMAHIMVEMPANEALPTPDLQLLRPWGLSLLDQQILREVFCMNVPRGSRPSAYGSLGEANSQISQEQMLRDQIFTNFRSFEDMTLNFVELQTYGMTAQEAIDQLRRQSCKSNAGMKL